MTGYIRSSRQDWLPRSAKPEPGKLVHSNHVEAIGESKLDIDMSTFKIELAGHPNSCIIKMNKQKFCGLLDSGAEVSHSYKGISLLRKTKTKETKCISPISKR